MKHQLKNLVYLSLLFFLMGCGSSPSSTNTDKGEAEAAAQIIPMDEPADHTLEQPSENKVKNETETETEAAITEIRKNYQKIRQAIDGDKLRQDVKEYECENDTGGGKLIRYYNGNDLVLIEHSEGGEHHWRGKEVYLQNGEPFFIFEEDGSWRFGGPGDGDNPTTIDKIEERRYYIQNGKLIHQLLKQYEIKSWEKEKTSDQVPNQAVELKAGATYPSADDIPKMILGDVGC